MQKIGPKHTMCRRVGEPLCGRPNCPSNKRPYPPGQHGRGRKRISEYQTRLVEKQKLRAIYGVSEAQMKRYYEKASNSMDVTGEELIRQLETRLDTVILRLGFALTTRQARQLVSHGHVKLDGKRINVPSARVTRGNLPVISDSSAAPASAAQTAVLNLMVMPEAFQVISAGMPSAHPSTPTTPPSSG